MDPIASGGGGGGYPDSVDSSPRSRGGESWDEPFPPSSAAKLRLMCSYGGRIVPRPTDKSLCYLGGETRIVVADRLSSLADLSAKLSRSLLGGRPFTLKYQLPNEDLDSLISVTGDEDLENMIDEYDRIAAAGSGSGTARSSRLRLFLFPSKADSAPPSLLDDSKSDTWFVDALNHAIGVDGLPRGLSADASSVNCLLGLEDDGASASAAASDRALPRPDSSGKLARQDVHSIPDSPMLDTSSSFGSASSAPLLSNLPPIRVRPDDRQPDQRIAGLDDHFAQMNLTQRTEEAVKETGFLQPQLHLHPPLPAAPQIISPTENPNRVFSSDDEKSEHGGARKPPPQQRPIPVDAPIPDSINRPLYYQERPLPTAVAATNPISDPSYRVPTAQIQQEPIQQQLQQPFIQHANPHYINPVTGAVLPYPSYYQLPHPMQQQTNQPQLQFDQQIPMYYMQVRHNPQQPSYNLPESAVQIPAQAKPAASLPKIPPPKPELVYRPAQMIHMPTDQSLHYPGMGYHMMQQPSQPSAMITNYGYDFSEQAHQAPVYYTQTSSPPSLAPQYQTMSSAVMATIADSQQQTITGEARQARPT